VVQLHLLPFQRLLLYVVKFDLLPSLVVVIPLVEVPSSFEVIPLVEVPCPSTINPSVDIPLVVAASLDSCSAHYWVNLHKGREVLKF